MRTVDLFAGAGGLSLGFQQAGFDIVAAYDAWLPALECYSANLDHPVYQFDLSDIEESTKHINQYMPDIIIGGPPCQDFSSAGKRREGKNANLTNSFISIVTGIMPSIMMMENVPRARTSLVYEEAEQMLNDSGYQMFRIVLDASKCGTPQVRKRYFVFAWKNQSTTIKNRIEEYFNDSICNRQMTVRDYMEDEIEVEHYYRHPRNYSRRGVFSIDEPSPTIRGVNRPIPPNYVGHHLDTAPVDVVRPLTSHERSRIQTFPREWEWDAGHSKTNIEQLIGNAVPVELAKFVGLGIMESIA